MTIKELIKDLKFWQRHDLEVVFPNGDGIKGTLLEDSDTPGVKRIVIIPLRENEVHGGSLWEQYKDEEFRNKRTRDRIKIEGMS